MVRVRVRVRRKKLDSFVFTHILLLTTSKFDEYKIMTLKNDKPIIAPNNDTTMETMFINKTNSDGQECRNINLLFKTTA